MATTPAPTAPDQCIVQRSWRRSATGVGLAVAVAVAAVNLRPAVVAVGPLTSAIRSDTGLSSIATSLLTTVPLICFGVFAAAAAMLAAWWGPDRAVLASSVLVVGGIALRVVPSPVPLFVGTVIAAAGIALGNVLVPAAVKQYLPRRVGSVMALYSVALQGGAAAAAGLTAPVAGALGLGWRPALGLWALPAALAVLVWLPRAVGRRRPATDATADEPSSGATTSVWRSSLGWAAAAFIGLQSAVFYALTGWLPSLLQDDGLSTSRAGLALSIVGLAGIAGGLPVPVLATRMRTQRPLVLVVVGCFTTGLLGLLLSPAHPALVWATLLGLGQGAGLSLALTLFTLRARSVTGAARLSGMAQTAGYLVAALGPLVVGWAHALTGGWTAPTVVLIVSTVPLTVAGLRLATPRFVEDDKNGAPGNGSTPAALSTRSSDEEKETS